MNPLARLTATDHDGSVMEFSLFDKEPSWTGTGREDAEGFAFALSSLFPMRKYTPAQGQPGAMIAARAAQWLKERANFASVALQMEQKTPLPAGTIY